jgi:serine/threonine protein kinase
LQKGIVSTTTNKSLPGVSGTVFAVKVLRSCMMDADSTRDFRREALLLGRVDHPGIIKLYHYGKVPQPDMVGSLINFVFLSF